MEDVLGYHGRTVVVSGSASGMGEATARVLVELGAEVHAVDIKPSDVTGLASSTLVDLRRPDEITAAVEGITGEIDALFNCAGLPSTFPDQDIMLVNFCGLRELTEQVIPRLSDGGSVASVASVAGMGWNGSLARLMELLGTADFAGAAEWCERNVAGGAAYGVSKEAINAYTAFRSFELAGRGLRINCINPGPTETPMMPAFEQAMGKRFMDDFPKPLGRNSRSDEQAWPLVFLNSPRASYVTGASLFTDGGFVGALFTSQVDMALLMPEGLVADSVTTSTGDGNG